RHESRTVRKRFMLSLIIAPDALQLRAASMKRAFPVLLACVLPAFAQERYDLVVYGGTAGGIITAVSGAREGLKVALLEASAHLCGMATGGLSRTDFGKKEVIGG